jgi:ABC-type multidrug transport system ATPase subunit
MAIETDRLTSRLEAVVSRARDDNPDIPAIETHGLTKRYGEVIAVQQLDLRVEHGEIFGFLGPNGAGKTTTMRMLLGLVRPTSGEARVLGMNIATEMPAILRRTGSVIENPTFYPYLSGRDNLRAFAKLAGIDRARIDPVLKLIDLTGAADRRFSGYSLGMKQRLAVGAALLGSPDLLILDEPANGLDPAGIVEMRDLVRSLKSYGHTVLISSHVLHEIEQICDRIAIMSLGKIVVQGRVTDLLGGETLLVRTDAQDEALEVLGSTSWVDGVSATDDGLIVRASLDRASEITRVLAERGIYLSRLQPHEQSLEQYFLDVTGGAQ